MKQKQSIWTIIPIVISLTSLYLFISPFLLFRYLSQLDAQRFFSFLISEIYLYPYLLVISTGWLFLIFLLYIVPFLFFKLIQTSLNSKKIINPFRLSKLSYGIVIFLNPILFISLLSLINNAAFYIQLLGIVLLLSFNFIILSIPSALPLKFIKLREKTIEKLKLKSIISIFITLTLSFLYYFHYNSIHGFIPVPAFIFTSIVIVEITFNLNKIQSIFTKETNPDLKIKQAKRIDKIAFLLMISISILLLSFITSKSIIKNLDNDLKFKDALIPFSLLLFFIYILPNIISLKKMKTKSIKSIAFATYFLLFFLITNIVDVIAYRSFNTMQFINTTKIEISASKWSSPKTPIPIKQDKIQMIAFNAFQLYEKSIFCEYENIDLLINKIEFNFFESKKIHSKCIFVNNDDVNLVEKDKFIKITPTSEEPTLHQYQHL
ncbi:hypothetical protein ABN239_03460 [Providencia vermicola]|uniref:hypothetical protein n=1 Tax=Providencia vermicola TaxID=333965 RepID=UPI0032DB7989